MKVLTTLALFAAGLVGVAIYCCHEPATARRDRLELQRAAVVAVSLDDVWADTGTPLRDLTHNEMVAEIQRQRQVVTP